MNRYIRLLILSIIISCVSPSIEARFTYSIKVSGIVRGITSGDSHTLIINECDASEKSERCIAELDSAGRFEINMPFYYGHTFTINYKRTLFINAYAEPGDSIYVSIDASKSPVEFHLSGDRSKLNEEYSHAFCDLEQMYYEIALPPDTVPLSDYLPKFKSEVARTRTIIDKYVEEKSMLPETVELLYLDNLFSVANQSIGFEGNGIDEQIAFFTDSLFDIFNERNLKVMIFPSHLKALQFRAPATVDIMPKSIIRDIMYAMQDEIEPARNEFENPAYYDRLYSDSKKTIDFSELKPGQIVIMENDTVYDIDNTNPIEWLQKRFESRPIYLDVSATWCGPCRAGLVAGESVREQFINSDIIFAVIWLKSDIESWKAFAPKINNTVHIFIPDDDLSNRMMSILNMTGFPAYYFIDRDGKTSTDVPHFNDPQLIDYLRSGQ